MQSNTQLILDTHEQYWHQSQNNKANDKRRKYTVTSMRHTRSSERKTPWKKNILFSQFSCYLLLWQTICIYGWNNQFFWIICNFSMFFVFCFLEMIRLFYLNTQMLLLFFFKSKQLDFSLVSVEVCFTKCIRIDWNYCFVQSCIMFCLLCVCFNRLSISLVYFCSRFVCGAE